MESTPEAPVFVTKGGIHCTELSARAGQVNADVRKTQTESIEIMKRWVDEFYGVTPGKNRRWSGGRGRGRVRGTEIGREIGGGRAVRPGKP